MDKMAQTNPTLAAELREFASRWHLTPRETEILNLISRGVVRIKDIAEQLTLSPNTVNNHINSIFTKTQTRSKSQLLAIILDHISQRAERFRLFGRTPSLVYLGAETSETQGVMQALRQAGLSCELTSNPETFLHQLRWGLFQYAVIDADIISQDWSLWLKNNRLGSDPRIHVIIVGSSNKVDCATAMNFGAGDCLVKPFTAQSLYDAVMAQFVENDSHKMAFNHAKLSQQAAVTMKVEAGHMGRGGVFVPHGALNSTNELENGDVFDLQVQMPDVPTPIVGRAQVVWKRSPSSTTGAHGYGARFVNLSLSDRKRIYDFISRHKIESYIPGGFSL
jgi:DNA-binding CsgD family transcriptional regulator/ActR/RegA family two-component response regulator